MDGFLNYKKSIKVLVGIADIVLIHISFILSFIIRYRGKLPSLNYSAYISALPYIIITFVVINLFAGIYILYNKQSVDVVSITVVNQVMLMVFNIVIVFFGRFFAFPRTVLFINLFVSIFILAIWRIFVLNIYLVRTDTSRIMLVGPKEKCLRVLQNFELSNNQRYEITSVTIDNYYFNIKRNNENIDIFYILDFGSLEEEKKILSYLTLKNKEIFLDAEFGNILRINNRIKNINDESLIAIEKFEISPEKEIIKRSMDLVLSIFIIILTSPIMLLGALLIKLTSEGPVLYRQIRITKDQKEFLIYKFRTMHVNAEELSGPVLAAEEDPRITSIGKHLRSLRIDELPQLFNVLKGDMSIIGPRPERPFFVEQYNERNPYYYLRHNVRAGITGYAQVHGTYTTNFYQKLKFDLLYIKKYTLTMDIQILFQTVRILFDKVSSKGLEENEVQEIFSNIDVYE